MPSGEDDAVELLRVPALLPDDLPGDLPDDLLDGLVDLLRDAVDDGASVGFVHVPSVHDATVWWRRYLEGGWTWVAVDRSEGTTVAGTVSLRVDQPENAPHRADLTKLLVHRRHRGRGIARLLVTAAEEAALSAGRTLLVLDTETGSPAEAIYERWGWRRVGTIEGYAVSPAGRLEATTFFSKVLDPVVDPSRP